jgi:caspase domain-containing protein
MTRKKAKRQIPDNRSTGGVPSLERERLQHEAAVQARLPTTTVKIQPLERDGEHLWLFPDGDRHERRIQRAIITEQDRIFWATIAVACGAPLKARGRAATSTVAKRYGTQKKARHDLDAFYEYYRPTAIGSPYTVFPGGAVPVKSPGFFEFTARLDNPTVDELNEAISRVATWVDANQGDPEYRSFQVNFCFSGHGDVSSVGTPSIVLADQVLSANDLASMLYRCIPDYEEVPAPSRLDLYLDCCRATGIAHSIIGTAKDIQDARDCSRHSCFELGQVYCACLDDEESFELSTVSHSLFTYAFLNECSRKLPEGAASLNLGLRDVGWFTRGQQHPWLLDCTAVGGPMVKFPSAYYLTHPPASQTPQDLLAGTTIDYNAADLLGEWLRVARVQRAACVTIEQELTANPALHKEFSRQEIVSNEKFPFL